MDDIVKIVMDFIDICHFKNDIESVILTGSHASGLADEFSDIDIIIILAERVNWRERGNRRVGGHLIEYFANPLRQIKKYIESDHAGAGLNDINMILSGIVVMDNNSIADELIAFCKEKLLHKFPSMSEFEIKNGLYHLWDSFDELNRAHAAKTADFVSQYNYFVQAAFALYSRFTCSPVPGHRNLYRWLSDYNYQQKFGLPPHHDQIFTKMVKSAMECEGAEHMHAAAKALYAYITDKMGGFDIGNFTLRGEC